MISTNLLLASAIKRNKKTINTISKNGVVYTPEHIVLNMLKLLDYKDSKIIEKHIIDNSCGSGSFLVEIVKIYIKEYIKLFGSTKGIENYLGKYIHGIELDKKASNECIKNLNTILLNFNIKEKIDWNIENQDTLKTYKFNHYMDYVIGNPPYIRIHNLKMNYKSFAFSKNGMTDLFIIFFEIGLRMLNKGGQLIYITPNSYFTSNAATTLRKHLYSKKMIKQIVNLKHYNPFIASTYTAITHISNEKNEKIKYFEYDEIKNEPKKIENISLKKCFLNNQFYFAKSDKLKKFTKIITTEINETEFSVKNGIATNLDSFFFSDNHEGFATRKAYKISTGKYTNVFFPYDSNNKLISIDKIMKKNPYIYDLLLINKNQLLKRDLQKQQWYEFGRTQGLRDVNTKKIVINNIIRDIRDIKLKLIPKNIVVYAGYYIIANENVLKIIIDSIKSIEFIEYLKILGKDKNNKYYFYSSNDLKRFLSFKLNQKNSER